MKTLAIVWVLFNATTGHPATGPHTFADSSSCGQAASTYMRLSKQNEQYRCESIRNVVNCYDLVDQS